MRILITGGTGLIGRALTASLAAEGHEVIVLTRNPDRAGSLPEGARPVGWDAETHEGWGELLAAEPGEGVEGGTGIVHLAGESVAGGRWTEARKRAIRDSRLVSTRAVAAAVVAAAQTARACGGEPPRCLLQASAVGYYGDRGDEVLTEASDPGEDFLAGLSKEWEAASAPVEALGVRRVLLRTGVVLAEEGGALPRMALPFKMFLGGPLGDGRQWVPWIHRSDQVGAIRFLLNRDDATGPYNLTAPHPVTQRELCRTLARVLHRPSLFPVPRGMLRLVLGEMADVVLASQRVMPQRLEEAGYPFRHPDLGGALEDLLG
jgi:uncharacterized protein (TIGR01777 family)